MTISHVLGPTKLTYDIMNTDECYEAVDPLLDSKILFDDFISMVIVPIVFHRLVLLPRDSRHSAGVRHRRAVCPRR